MLLFSVPNAYFQVTENDGSTFVLRKYWIFLGTMLVTMRRNYAWMPWIGVLFCGWSLWQWWLSPDTKSLFLDYLDRHWIGLASLVGIIAILIFCMTLLWAAGAEDESDRNNH